MALASNVHRRVDHGSRIGDVEWAIFDAESWECVCENGDVRVFMREFQQSMIRHVEDGLFRRFPT